MLLYVTLCHLGECIPVEGPVPGENHFHMFVTKFILVPDKLSKSIFLYNAASDLCWIRGDDDPAQSTDRVRDVAEVVVEKAGRLQTQDQSTNLQSYILLGEVLDEVDGGRLTRTTARTGHGASTAGHQELSLALEQALHHQCLEEVDIVEV